MRALALDTVALLLPLLGGAVAHGVCMRFEWLTCLKRPIDGGRKWRGQRVFGHSKTWRGPVLVAAGAAAVWALQQRALPGWAALAGLPGPWFAALAGFVAELGELPNSFVKRQLGVAPGATARGPLAALFYVADQIDVILGWWLVLAWVVPDPLPAFLLSLVLGVAFHPVVTLIGYALGMRPTAR